MGTSTRAMMLARVQSPSSSNMLQGTAPRRASEAATLARSNTLPLPISTYRQKNAIG